MEMTSNVYADLNGNNTKDAGDRFGFKCSPVFVDSFYFASGLRTTEIAADGSPFISPDFYGEKVTSLIEKLNKFFYNSTDAFLTPDAESMQRFYEGNTLFSNLEIAYSPSYLRESSFIPVYALRYTA